MSRSTHWLRRTVACALVLAVLPLSVAAKPLAQGSTLVSLSGTLAPAVAAATPLALTPLNQPIELGFVLPWSNLPALNALAAGLYNPASPRYGQFLSSQQFAGQFGPSAASVTAVTAYVTGFGLQVTSTVGNMLVVHGTIGQAAQALHVAFRDYYAAAQHRQFYAAQSEPRLPTSIAAQLLGLIGMDDLARPHPHLRAVRRRMSANPCATPPGAVTPRQIISAYNLTADAGQAASGQGQALASIQLTTGIQKSDVNAFLACFGLPNSYQLTRVAVDGGTTDTSAVDEETLDVEMQLTMATGAARVYVYEAPGTTLGYLLGYGQIASDDLAKSVSSSYGLCSLEFSASAQKAEYLAFLRMVVQGQGLYSATGDFGSADSCGRNPALDDPTQQPYLVDVGGTVLNVNANGSYAGEQAWPSSNGGVSVIFPKPAYQQGVGYGKTRNAPDVALVTQNIVFYLGGIVTGDGTSFAAPLWAGFAALVNQQRAAAGKPVLGFGDPALYRLAENATTYAQDFHDVTVGNNGLWPALPGYDDVTGWGSFNGHNLIQGLVSQ